MNVYLNNGSKRAVIKNCKMPSRSVSDICREMLHNLDGAADIWARESRGVSKDRFELDTHVYSSDGMGVCVTIDGVMRFIYVSLEELSEAPPAATIIAVDAWREIERGIFELENTELEALIKRHTGETICSNPTFSCYWREIMFTSARGREVRLCVE